MDSAVDIQPNVRRERYVDSALNRLDRMTILVDRIASNARDLPALRDLVFHFHQLRGSAASFGFPTVSRMASRAEREASGCLDGARRLDAATVLSVRTLVESMRREMQKDPASGAAEEWSLPSVAQQLDMLVLDGGVEVARILEHRFRRDRHRVRQVGTCADARDACESSMPHIVVIDVETAGSGRRELVERIRGISVSDSMLVMEVGANGGFVERVNAGRDGADAFLGKPLDRDTLITRIDDFATSLRTRPRALVVDDDSFESARVRAILEQGGMEVHACEEPARLEAALAAAQPDVVLLAAVLPGFTGIDLVRYLRLDPRYALAPVIVLTREESPVTRIEVLRAGADDCVAKPQAATLLLATVSTRIERSRAVRGLLRRDALTHLLTRAAFMERVEREVTRLGREPNRSAALVLIDIDEFRQVNDTHGHPTGDRVIAGLAELMRRRLRKSDLLGRYGGEEFAVVLDRIDFANAERVTEKLLDEFAGMPQRAPDGGMFNATFSAGIAMFQQRMEAEGWVAAAERALQTAKAAGRRRVMIA